MPAPTEPMSWQVQNVPNNLGRKGSVFRMALRNAGKPAHKKSPFFRFWEVLWHNFSKLILINLLYTFLHIPLFCSMVVFVETNNKFTNLVTLLLLLLQVILEGPILSGCARVMRLVVLDKAFFLGEEFKKGFSRNFWASLLYWLLDSLVLLSALAGYWVYPVLAEQTGTKAVYIPYVISLSIALVLLFMNFYIFTLQATTSLNKRNVLKNSFMLAFLSPKQCIITLLGTLLMLALSVLMVWINSYLMFVLAFFPAAFIGYLVMFVNYPVVQKYVIHPYYEETGEANPEEEEEIPEEERVFTDRSETEPPVEKKQKKKGKVIS